MKTSIISIVAVAAATSALAFAPSASASVVVDSQGHGFVGKGDVQVALGWNNKQLQDGAAGTVFTYRAQTVQESTWTCVNGHNANEQYRARTTTSTVSGIASSVARETSKGKDGAVTGFRLTGLNGSETSQSSTEGPALGSCPNSNSTFTVTDLVIGEPVVGSSGLFANGVPLG